MIPVSLVVTLLETHARWETTRMHWICNHEEPAALILWVRREREGERDCVCLCLFVSVRDRESEKEKERVCEGLRVRERMMTSEFDQL